MSSIFGSQILLSNSSPMQNVDVIKSHYLKGKQPFYRGFCKSNIDSAQEICPSFPASEAKIEERISAVVEP